MKKIIIYKFCDIKMLLIKDYIMKWGEKIKILPHQKNTISRYYDLNH